MLKIKKNNMSIEEKAEEFAGYNLPSAQDIVTTAKMSGKYDGFKAGAEWMLEKALDWIGDNVVFNKFGRPVDAENFRKSMEE